MDKGAKADLDNPPQESASKLRISGFTKEAGRTGATVRKFDVVQVQRRPITSRDFSMVRYE